MLRPEGALQLSVFQDLPAEEVGRVMERSANAARVLLHREEREAARRMGIGEVTGQACFRRQQAPDAAPKIDRPP